MIWSAASRAAPSTDLEIIRSNSQVKIVTVVGARPQFIKAAPVSRAILSHNGQNPESVIHEVLVHTGQHYDDNMSRVFFEELSLRNPDYNLGVGSGRHGAMTGAMLEKVESVLIEESPDWLLTYGDTNSTLAGALAAAKLHIAVAHVEAGLRSYNSRMPEEINRVLTDHLASMLFCPTETAVNNLAKEGIGRNVFNVGDVMYDAFLFNAKLSAERSRILTDLGLEPRGYCLATVHRQENTDDPDVLLDLFGTFDEVSRNGCPVVVPIHPRTRQVLETHPRHEGSHSATILIPPVSYLDMIALEVNAKLILTDSGGVQKEAYFAQVPCITLRNETEWVETIQSGMNVLASTNRARILEAFQFMPARRPAATERFFGDGEASRKIVSSLLLGRQTK
jgi:UDP-N-acetylglucosamine 2-epimerase